MEEKIRKVIKVLLWVVFGGAAILGLLLIIIDAFKNPDLFKREAGTFLVVTNSFATYILLGLAVWVGLYWIEKIWRKLKSAKK